MGGSVKLDGFEHEDDALSLALRAVRLERATFTQAVVARGCSIRHAGGVDEDASLVCYQVLEGACALDAGRGEARPLRAGTLVLVAARMTHEVRLLEGATSPAASFAGCSASRASRARGCCMACRPSWRSTSTTGWKPSMPSPPSCSRATKQARATTR